MPAPLPADASSVDPRSPGPVRPDPRALAAIARLPLGRRGLADGLLAGAHRGGRGGFSVEFAGHRPYQIGDDPRRIDWRKRSRHVGDERDAAVAGLVVKQFESETGLAVHLAVDASAGMAYRGPGADGREGRHPSKWRFAATLAATLTETVLRRRDAISLSVLQPEGKSLPASAAPARAAGVCDLLSAVVPGGDGDVSGRLAEAVGGWGRRGVAVILSDLLADPDRWFAALTEVRRRGHEAAVLRTLAPAEVAFPFPAPRRFRPLAGGATTPGGGANGRAVYRRAFAAHAEELAAACRRAGVSLTVATADEPVADVLVRLLTGRAGG